MGHGVAGLLLAAAAGYWVLTLAVKEKPNLKKIGQVVGLVIIVVSLVGVACKIYCLTTGCPTARGWMGKGGAACLFTGKAAPSAPSTAQP